MEVSSATAKPVQAAAPEQSKPVRESKPQQAEQAKPAEPPPKPSISAEGKPTGQIINERA
ncbi:hypothetical protein [Pelomonas sp. SE-A7]|uniref:hypothetical protein n=1 Tax=Pelomonas sp. SE-A7 TaxID=3054953 RepID=UPI00259C8B10|nr:hypothetical protein [Pelomonas sp. SE-A7]MDM4767285.1 hypothetical protein [Pelomonas sp. SE-A7]